MLFVVLCGFSELLRHLRIVRHIAHGICFSKQIRGLLSEVVFLDKTRAVGLGKGVVEKIIMDGVVEKNCLGQRSDFVFCNSRIQRSFQKHGERLFRTRLLCTVW